MRVLEGLMFLLSITFTILMINERFKKIKWSKYIPSVTFSVFIFHIIFEKIRWQLYPLYVVIIFYFVITILYMIPIAKIKVAVSKAKIRKRIVVFSVIFIVISGALAFVFPVYKMPVPTGKYEIGTQSFDITDPERGAIYSGNLDNNRKIKIQVWYPAETTEGYERVAWIEDGKIVAEALAKDMGLPSFSLDQTALVVSNSYKNAPISDELDKYPVVIISHGWTGFRDLHADVAERLASNGYIVVGIDHTYGSEITVFNDGEVAYLNKDALPDRETTPDFLEYANKLVTTYASDVSLTLDELEKFNKGQVTESFKGKLDLSRIGLLGHSTGGGGDVSIAIEDVRIKAVVGMDAWVEPIYKTEIEKGLKVPSLFMRSEQWSVGENNENLLMLVNTSTGPISIYQINGMYHSDFSMVYMYSPLTKLVKLTGQLDGRTSSLIQKDFIQSFFDKNLKGDNSMNIDEIADKWEDVEKIK